MKLSIITINRNNAVGLRKTIESVLSQTYRDIEYIIIDGASTDNSVDVIRKSVLQAEGLDMKWISEPDKGIYDGMNKGIEIALGKRIVDAFNRSKQREDKNKVLPDYVWILNSGDCAAAPDVVEKMMTILNEGKIDLLMGNIVRILPNNKKQYAPLPVKRMKDEKPCSMDVSMLTFYIGTVPQDAAFVRRDLFEKYGYFDDKQKIVSDWKLYLNMIALGGVQPMYVNIDVVLFDMSGVSNANMERRNAEKRAYLEEILPASVLQDFDAYAFPIEQYKRLKKYHLWPIVYFMERVLFKFNKWGILK